MLNMVKTKIGNAVRRMILSLMLSMPLIMRMIVIILLITDTVMIVMAFTNT